MSDSEQEYDPAASAEAAPNSQEDELNSHNSPEAESKEISTDQSEQPSAAEDSSEKSDAESEYNPEVSDPEPPKASTEDKNNEEDEEDDYDPEALLSDEGSAAPRTLGDAAPATTIAQSPSPSPLPQQEPHQESPLVSQPIPENDAPLSKGEKIQQFNSIITHFMSTPYLNDPTFQSLTPDQKSMVVLADYNKAKGTNIKTPINFHATTSFNKQYMKRNETAFPMVPVNPFCKRPDINAPKSFDFQQEYNDFITEETKWLRTGRVETLPSGSRLFIGNLPVNTIAKEDCYKIFRPYGEIVQISIKPGYGFIQFATAEGCNDALEGETNVPLHGKMLQLEISKTQIRQAQEYQEKQRRKQGGQNDRDGPAHKESGPYSRRGRSRSPSPGRDSSYKRRSPQQSRAGLADEDNSVECYIFQLPDASPMFVRKLLKVVRKQGISFKTEQNVSDVESAGNDAAYAGAMAVVVVNADDLNVKTFEKTADGGIKFDEYTNISVEEADSILSAAKAKRGGGHSQNSAGFDQKDYYKTNNSNNNNNNNRNNSGGSRQRGGDSRGGRGRGNGRGRGGFEAGQGGYHGNNNNNNNNHYGGGYQGYQPPVPPQNQLPPPQQAPGMDPSAIIAQLQNYDPNTIQQVLSLLGNQQQQQQQQHSPPMPQQQYGGYQPPAPLPQQQYGGYNAPPPQQQYYQQLPPPQQQQYYQQPPQQQPQAPPPQHQQQPLQGGSSGSSLLEALARLKKNS